MTDADLEWCERVKRQIQEYESRYFSSFRDEVSIIPEEDEIFFYTPFPVPELEVALQRHYDDIKALFASRKYKFIYLPELNKDIRSGVYSEQIEYYNPRSDARGSKDLLSYEDIRDALAIPEWVDEPCFIRCRDNSDWKRLFFSYFRIKFDALRDIMAIAEDYFDKVGTFRMYCLEKSDNDIRKGIEGLPADKRFEEDMYLIGHEIQERIEKLRSMGLTTLAIRKLIGDDSSKPSRLFIDKHYHIFLTDFDNREIKLSPLHKAVFFLFLKHPEGIYFKDLEDYKEELAAIYNDVTGRHNKTAVADSISRLVDPYDNSINEKCARIKNAFVSEFREEVARWYFIDGSKGEKKCIKLNRVLVTWERDL